MMMTSSSGDGAACPSDPVVFTCTVSRTVLQWTVAPPPDHLATGISQIVRTSSSTLQPFDTQEKYPGKISSLNCVMSPPSFIATFVM